MPKKLTRTRPHLARCFHPRLLSAAIVAAGQALHSLPTMAGPEGGRVTAGDGTIEYNGEVTTIEQLSDRLAVDWNSFDVSAEEIVNFQQPSTHSIALNRILGRNGSEILGQINANGRVVLVNPHGIVFGEGAQVNVGGILASGLNIGVEDFMAGNLTFSALEGAEGRVVNQGIIQAATGGSVTLLGKQVKNEGLISAHLGSVNLAAGKEAVVTFDPEGLMGVRVTRAMVQDELGAEAALSNSGNLEAKGGQILLTASTSQELFSQAVNRGDQDQAHSVVVHEDGSFTLGSGADVVNTGRLDVSSDVQSAGEIAVLGRNVTHNGRAHAVGTGQAVSGHIELHAQDTTLLTENAVLSASNQTGQGGTIKVLGHKVGLMGQSLVDASGAMGGGNILVGGDYKGGNVEIRNAWRTYVGPQAILKANALEAGDGGRIIVWADDITRYYGGLEGKGRGALGQGGFAEVSGKRLLDFEGSASLYGAGIAGTLLLDPRDISIVGNFSGNDDDSLPIASQDETVAFEDFGADGDVSFTTGKITELLEGSGGDGTNVILEATRDISVKASISANSENSLSLKAGDDIQVENFSDISVGEGDLLFYAGVASCGGDGGACGTEDNEVGQNNNLTGRSIDIQGELHTAGRILLKATDNVIINSAIGSSTSPSAVSVHAGNDLTLGSGASITTAATVPASGDTTIVMLAGDDSLTNATDLTIDHIQLKTTQFGTKSLISHGVLSSNGGNISLYAPSAVTLAASPETSGGSLLVGSEDNRVGSFDSTGASLNTTSAGQGGDITIYSHGEGTLGGASFGGASGVGNLTVDSASDNITLNGNYLYNSAAAGSKGGIELIASLGDVSFSGTSIDNGQDTSQLDITVSAGGKVSLVSDSGTYLTGGSFTVNESGSIDLNQNNFNTEGGLVSLSSSGEVKVQRAVYTGGGSFTVAESNSFVSSAEISTLGGLVELRSSGGASINGAVNTGGGDFTVAESGAFTNSSTISTQAADVAGDITVTSLGDVTLGNLDVSASGTPNWGGGVEVTSAQNIILDQAFDFNNTGSNDDGGNGSRSLTLSAANSINVNAAIYDSSDAVNGLSYYDTLDVTLNADTDGSGEGDIILGSSVYTAGGGFSASGVNFTANGYDVNTNEGKSGVESSSSTGGHITLTMTGDVNLGALTTKAGDTFGNLTITGETITGTDPLTVNGTSSLTATSVNVAKGFITLDGDNQFSGAVSLDSSAGVTLVNRGATQLGVASIGGALNLTSFGDVSSDGAVTVVGTSTFTVTDGGDNHYDLELNNAGNSFAGEVSIGRASSVDLYGQGSLEVGNVNTTGEDNAPGGNITLKAGSLTVGALEANAGARNGGNDGKDSGAIVLESDGALTITNHLSAQAHSGQGRADGTSRGIELRGDVVLDADGTLSGPILVNTQMLGGTTGGAGQVTFNRSLDSASGSAQNLQIDAGAVTFSGAIGESVGLDTLTVNALGSVTLGGAVVPTASSIVISGQGDASKSLTATDTLNEWVLKRNPDDGDSTTRNTLNTLIKFTGFDTLVGGSSQDHFTVDIPSGAEFAMLNGGSATGNQVTATGNWSVSADGTGSVLTSNETTSFFSNIQTFNGEGGSSLQGPNGSHTWTVKSLNAGSVQQTVPDGETASYSYDFTGMDTLIGGAGNDEFIVNVGATIGELRGVAENETDTGLNTLLVESEQGQSVAWLVASDNSGSAADVDTSTDTPIEPFRVTNFYDISELEGGEGADTFTATSYNDDASVIIDGGTGGDNAFSLSEVEGNVTLSIGGADEVWSLNNIQEVEGRSGSESTLKIAGGTNTWMLNDQNSGTLQQTGAGDDLFSGVLNFSDFANLSGGDGNDSFVFITDADEGTVGSLTGSLSGGSDGTDTLTGRNGANLWTLGTDDSDSSLNQLLDNSDSANPVAYVSRFSNIDKLQGGTSSDIFQFGDGAELVQIDGGSVTGNRLDFSQKTQNVTVTIGSGDLGGIENIQGFVGNAAQEITATLEVVDGNNQWDLVGQTKESSLASSEHGSAVFTGFNVVRGGSGKDDFTLTAGENFQGTVNGGSGSENTLTLTDGTNTWALTGAHGGNVAGRIQTFENIQTLTGAGGDTLVGRGQNNAWELDGSGWSVQNASNAGDSVSFSGMSVLKGNSFADAFTIAEEQSFTGSLDGVSGTGNTLTVEGGSNTWSLGGAHGGDVAGRVQTFENIQTLTGTGGDTLIGRNQNNAWELNGSGNWSVRKVGDASDRMNFSGMSILKGNSLVDAFTLAAEQSFTGTLDGVSGTGNTLTVEGGSNTWSLGGAHGGDVAGRVQTFSNIQGLTGTGGDTLIGRNQSNTWELDGSGSWSVRNTSDASDRMTFSGMSVLKGNSLEDAFMLAEGQSFTGTLDGVSGTGNTLAVEGGSNTWSLSGAHSGDVAGRVQTFSNIQALTGTGGDTLIGRNQNNTWALDDSGSWSVQRTGDASDRINFSGMSVLKGNSLADAFTLSEEQSFTGTLDGVSGTSNTLTVEGGSNTWSLAGAHGGDVAGRVQTFDNIQTLTGTGSDTVIGRNQNNAWELDGTGWSVQNASDGSDRVSFIGMSVLKGNSLADAFTLAEGQSFTGTVDGVSSTGNTLAVEGGPSRWVLTAEQGGEVTAIDGNITRLNAFSNIQTLQGAGSDEIQGLNETTHWHSDISGTWTLSSSDLTADRYLTLTGMSQLVGGSKVDTFTLGAASNYSGTLNGGVSDGDILAVEGGNARWVLSGYGSNGVNGNVASRVTTFEAINDFTGSGTDRLEGPDQANNWSLIGADTGTLSASDGIGATVDFSGMSVLLGGSGKDSFASSDSATMLFSGVIDGSVGGDDELDLTTLSGTAVTVGMLAPDNSASTWQARDDDGVTIRNIETLRADGVVNDVDGSEGNKLLGPVAGDYTWTLTAKNAGKVEPVYGNAAERTLNFFGFEYLESGAGKNDFVFDGGDVTGGISGGSGDAWLDYSLTEGDLCINLLSSTGGCAGPTLSGIAGVIGNGGDTYNSQLRLNASGENTWTIKQLNNRPAGGANDGINDGEVQADGQTIAFIDFNQLVGGSGKDTFRFDGVGQVTGYIDGRGGSDVVTSVNSSKSLAFRLRETPAVGSHESGVWLKRVETITANVANSDQLIGEEGGSAWVVDGENRGHINDHAITFSGIGALWGGSGSDTFTIEENGGLASGITGGDGTAPDRLNITSGDNDNLAWSVTGLGRGSADRAGSFEGVEVLGGGLGDDHFTLTGAEAWVDTILGSSGDNVVTYVGDGATATWTLTGGRQGSVLLGTSQQDIDFSAIGRIEGSGQDWLTASDAENTWTLSGSKSGTLVSTTTSDVHSLEFDGMTTLEGRGDVDQFFLEGVNFAGTLLGRNGDDVLSAQGANTWVLSATGNGTVNGVTRFEGIRTLNGGGEGNELVAPERDNDWRLTGERSGTLDDASAGDSRVTFTGMDTLTGNRQRDSFVAVTQAGFNRQDLQSFIALNGGGGAGDLLDLSNLSEAITLSLGRPVDGQESEHGVEIDGFISGFETLSAANYANHLLGASDRAYRWVVTGQNKGRVEYFENNTEATTVAFSNFARLTGGSASDTFAILDGGSTSGKIDGGGGINLIDFSQKSEAVNVTFGGLGGNISNISGVVGNNNGTGNHDSRLVLGETNEESTWRLGSIADVDQSCEENCQNDGINDGQVTLGGESLYFIDFNILEGGAGKDAFNVVDDGRFIGSLKGGAGGDTLNIADAGSVQSVGLGESSLADTHLVSVETLIGSNERQHALYGTDAGNIWRINANGGGTLNGNALTFSGMQVLHGGSGTDEFVITGEGKAHTLNAGAEAEGNTLDISEASSALWLSLDTESAEADIRLVGLDELTGNSERAHRLEGGNRNNRWNIDRRNGGTLNGALRFTELAILQGNEGNDEFLFAAGGRIDGYLHGGDDGHNRVDLGALAETERWTIATTESAQAELNLINIQTLDGRREAEHTLLGTDANTRWTITNINSGKLDELTFTGIANLVGGTGTDDFTFASAGELSGYLDGGAGAARNTVDLSDRAEVNITAGTNQGDLRRIDLLTGNNRLTTLTALDDGNTWRLEEGENAGRLNDRLQFTGVTHLVAGNGGDTFFLDGGLVTGGITGGAGNDRFDLALAPNAGGDLTLDGVGGDDELRVSGGASGTQVEYFARRTGGERLTYAGGGSAVFEVVFEGVEQVQDYVTANDLTINSSLNADTILMKNNSVQVDGLTQLNYSNKTNLTVAANTDDAIELSGALTIPGQLEIRNASVQQTTQDRLKAKELQLVGVDQFGTSAEAIHTDIDALYADIGQGGLSLNNEGVLSLAQLNTLGETQIYSGGNITSTANLTAAGELNLRSELGGIRLEGDNRFSGTAHFAAAHDIQLQHARDLTLGNVQGRTLTLNNRGDVNAEGAWTLDTAVLTVEGDIEALNPENRLGALRVEDAGNVRLGNASSLTVSELYSTGDVQLTSEGLDIDGRVEAGNLRLDGGSEALKINAAVSVEQLLEARANGIVVDHGMSAGALTMDTGEAALQLNESLTATGSDGVLLSGGRITQDADVTSAGAITINANNRFQQNATLEAQTGIDLVSADELVMARSARSSTETGTIRYEASDNLTVSYLENIDGTIALISDRRVESALGDEAGLRSQRIEFEAVEGIGTQQRLMMNTSELHATNRSGTVSMGNTGELRVERLANNGNIDFNNTGTVTLDNRDSPVYDTTATDALDAGGIANANYDQGTLRMTITDGDLVALGALNGQRPDLVGQRGVFLVDGDIGAAGRSLVMYFKDSLILQGVRSWSPVWAFNEAPTKVENNSAVQVSNQDLSTAGEQLVEVEGLEEIDPAIFTEVRNYTYDEVSILMPPDQRYGEEDDEERYSADY